ncbi:MAG: chondroitinase-B domain-containing protein [Bacteroidota bacterium]
MRRASLLLLPLAAFLLLAVTATSWAATLLSDNFQSYTSFPSGSWTNPTANGSWTIATDGDKVAKQTDTNSETYIVVNGNAAWTNYTYTARVKPGSSATRHGIIARYKDNKNYYFLVLKDGSKVYLYKRVNGSDASLNYTSFSYNTSTFYELKIELNGMSIKGYVNGALMVSATDGSIAAGKIGFYTYGITSYDDVLVTDTATASPTPPPTATPTATPAPTPTPAPTLTPTLTPTATPTLTPTPTLSATPTVTPTPTTPAGVNLALNKTVTFSSQQTGNEATHVNDGDTGNRWSASPYPQWVRIDLGAVHAVTWTELLPYNSRAYQYKIELSVDGSTYTQAVDRTGNTSGGTMLTDTFTTANARYIRLTITGCHNYTGGWASICEFRVFGGGASSPAPTVTPTTTPSPTPPATPVPSPSEGPTPAPLRTVNVSGSSALAAALSNAQAGDHIILANGTYSIAKVTSKNGTEANPIVVKAANRLGVTISSGQLETASCSYLIFEGIKWTTNSTIKLTSSHHIRLTRNHFRLTESGSLKWLIVQGAGSHHNRIDHNLFEEKHQLGNFITIDGDAANSSQYDRIDHNHFRNCGPRATNEMEAIRVGWSQISMSSGFTLVEYNLFENCDGDPEIVSVKSCDNTVRYNTFLTSAGVLSSRHGNRNSFYGNFFLGKGKAGTGGIRIYGQDHRIYNNYFEGLTGSGYDAPLSIDGGDVDQSGALSSHWRVYRAQVVFNTFVNNTYGIEIGKNYSLAPVDCVLANNVVAGSANQLFTEFKTPVNLTYAGNIAYPTSSATLGVTKTQDQIWVVDPNLVTVDGLQKLSPASPAIDAAVGSYGYVADDMDGQSRALKDVGADEYSAQSVLRRPLTASDVGPNAP